MIGKRRLLLAASALAGVGAVAAIVAGVTFGLFSSSQSSGANSFAAGTVSVGNPTSTTCTVTNMVAGDESTGYAPGLAGNTQAVKDATCTFQVQYGGSAPAFIGLKLSVGGTGLYDGSVTGLQFQVSDGSASYTTGGALNSTSQELYVGTDSGSTTHTFTVNYALPTNAGNAYQGKNTTLTLEVDAVQAGNNGTASGCTAGSVCNSITAWN